ncbi:helix-turn-helix domain-containing protein [Massilia violaceinigra]|uniref:Helix-turn-helix domain-containing protein n=2 Tax=Massilia violaceinigra TaxID=2045208 RepID=A0ABY4A309_9BURK|nr:helix-turn-helix domain-containing protein [Massilia violaceinigra]
MDTLEDDMSTALAHRVRLERDARGWSLAELASKSGVAKATISKIERGETSPTAVILVRLANAFGLTLAGLLLRAEGHDDASRLMRVAQQALWRDPDSAYLRRQIFARPDHPLEIVQVDMPPGQRVVLPASSYANIRQAIWVQAGPLSVLEGGDQHLLESGDCLGFGPPSEVTIANDGMDTCRYLVVLSRS